MLLSRNFVVFFRRSRNDKWQNWRNHVAYAHMKLYLFTALLFRLSICRHGTSVSFKIMYEVQKTKDEGKVTFAVYDRFIASYFSSFPSHTERVIFRGHVTLPGNWCDQCSLLRTVCFCVIKMADNTMKYKLHCNWMCVFLCRENFTWKLNKLKI